MPGTQPSEPIYVSEWPENRLMEIPVAVDDGVFLPAGTIYDYETDDSDLIDIIDVEEAPDFRANDFEIDENADPNTPLGTVAYSDPEGDEVTFALVNRTGAFTIDADSGAIAVADSATLDFEGSPISISVFIRDATGLTRTETFSITLRDVNEAPTIEPQAVPADGAVYAFDIDANDSFTFSTDSPGVTIDPDSGQLTVDRAQYPLGPSAITVTATDAAGLANSATVTIRVSFFLALEPGWNLISVPLEPDMPAASDLFAGLPIIGDLLEQSGDTLARATEVHAKSAYWLYLAGGKSRSVEILGDLVLDASIALDAGWHLIGPAANPSPWGLNDDIALHWNAKHQIWRSFVTPGSLSYGVGYLYYAETTITLRPEAPNAPIREWFWDGDLLDVWRQE